MLIDTEISKNADSCLEIFTLGRFVVRRGDQTINERHERSLRIWDLFKYFITHRNKCIFQETLISVLWPENECDDPVKSLQNFMSRLKILLNEEGSNNHIIYFSQGGYNWNKNYNYLLDIEEFENYYQKASDAHNGKNLPGAADLYQKALSLYKGDYMPKYLNTGWTAPVRNHYRRIYLDIVFKISEILRIEGRNSDIVNILEDALIIEPYEEMLHIQFMEALIREGNIKQTLNHYEYVSQLFYKEFGVKPSAALCDIYRRIKTQ